MGNRPIVYRSRLSDGRTEELDVALNRDALEPVGAFKADSPPWTGWA